MVRIKTSHRVWKQYFLLIADVCIRIVFHHADLTYLQDLLLGAFLAATKGFCTTIRPQKPYFTIRIREEKHAVYSITKKNEKNEFLLIGKSKQKILTTYYHIGVAQLLHLITKIVMETLSGKAFLLHASAVKIGNHAVLFLGKSGAGKSTIATLLSHRYKFLADDLILLKKVKSKYQCFQLPFIEKVSGYKRQPRGFEVRAVVFIKKAPYCRLTSVRQKDRVINKIANQIMIENRVKDKRVAYAMDLSACRISFYNLSFTKDRNMITKIAEKFNRSKIR